VFGVHDIVLAPQELSEMRYTYTERIGKLMDNNEDKFESMYMENNTMTDD
jgi:hypothetical protein